jgi:hypothetical protein
MKINCGHGFPSYETCPSCQYSFEGQSIKEIITKMNEAPDMVNHPPHYKVGGIETIDYIQAKLTDEEFSGYCKGNALKYISRANHKKDATEDLRKAIWYLNRLVNPENS